MDKNENQDSNVTWTTLNSASSSLYWLAGDVKEPTHLLRRVGNVAFGVVVWLFIVYTGFLINQF